MKRIIMFLFLFIIFTTIVECPEALANININDTLGEHSLEDYICTVLKFLTGGVGKALAAFACIGVSMAFIGGKVAWTTILSFALGMACIFGAPQIIKAFSGGNLACENADTVTD